MVFQLPCLVLEVTLSDCDILLIGAACFLVVISIVGSNCDPPGVPLLPLFAALGAFLSIFASGFGRCYPATVGGRFPNA
jgi:hypothetical protein